MGRLCYSLSIIQSHHETEYILRGSSMYDSHLIALLQHSLQLFCNPSYIQDWLEHLSEEEEYRLCLCWMNNLSEEEEYRHYQRWNE